MDETDTFKALLKGLLDETGCQTGTLHRTTPDGASLALVCEIGVPEALLDRISQIPIGKGIAGAAAERKEPVTLCNLQQDLGGVAKPDARMTGVSGSVAVPIFAVSQPGAVAGTLGIGKHQPHDFTQQEIARVEETARKIARIFDNKDPGGD